MYSYTNEVGNKLNNLLEMNYDAVKGYETAASNTNSNVLTEIFERKANERKMFGKELKNEIVSFNETPDKGGSFAGKVHRTWMDTKAFLSSNDDKAMLNEALRGEKIALKEYNEVINSDVHFPESTTKLLKSQRDTILNDAIIVKKLEEIK